MVASLECWLINRHDSSPRHRTEKIADKAGLRPTQSADHEMSSATNEHGGNLGLPQERALAAGTR
jgi:hypothetical protein